MITVEVDEEEVGEVASARMAVGRRGALRQRAEKGG